MGTILIIGFMVMGTAGILLVGTQALGDARSQSEVGAAEQAMTQLDSQFSLVALGSAEAQQAQVDLQGGASLRSDGDAGWMNLSAVNATSGEVEMTVMNVTLGAVSYEHDDTTIAYQGGGVWRGTDAGSVMVSPPEFHYRSSGGDDPTLTLPLVVVRGNDTLAGGDARVSNAETTAKYPEPGNADRQNPLTSGEINVTVQSEFYRAWGEFFEERISGTVTYDHDRNRVSLTLVVPASSPGVHGGIVSGASSTTLEFENQASTDSYNSSDGPYSTTSAENTSIIAAGDVDLSNQATIEGNLVTGGTLTTGNQAELTGNLSYGGSPPNDPSAIGGTIESGAEVETPDAVGWLIDDRIETLNESNDNAGSVAVDDSTDRLQGCAATCTLTAGDYHLEKIDLGTGDTLTLDTTTGDIEIAVDGDASFTGDAIASLTTGSGRVRIYVDGDLHIENQADVSVPDDRSPRLWFYMRPGRTAFIHNDGSLVGVVYGPGSGAQSGTDIDIKNQISVFGGLVGNVDTVKNGMGIHFDESLADEDPLAGFAAGQPTVTYLHITVNRVNVTAT